MPQHAPASEIGELTTEAVDERLADLDTRPVLGVLEALNDAEAEVPTAIRRVLPALAELVEEAAARVRDGGRVIYAGAGTSGRIGVLDAAEIPPTFHEPATTFQAMIAGGREAVFESAEGVEDSAEAGEEAVLDLAVGPADTVVAIAASGRTPFALGVLAAARRAGALTAAVTNNASSPMGMAADHAIEAVVGPEVVAGSTRLKAGSSAKQILNMLSTAIMVRNGKTYGNLMVDLTISNAKLRDRGERLVMTITGCDRDTAATALTAASDRVPVAAVMIAHGVAVEDAQRLLAGADGRLSGVLRT